MAVRGIRGATTVDADSPALIVDATRELLAQLIEANVIVADDVAGAWFTTTPDLSSEFPAVAARQLGWVDVPLICGQELDVPYDNPRSIARCVRVMILVNTERTQKEMRFLYLRGARAIQEELERARGGDIPQPAAAVHGRRPSDRGADPPPSRQAEPDGLTPHAPAPAGALPEVRAT
jgi:chorismate mutase